MNIHEYFNWLKKDWAKVGLILSLFLFIFLTAFVKPADFALYLLLIQTPLYMLHQTEEYIFPGGFAGFFNIDIFKLETPDKPLDENFIFYVNIFLIWIILPGFGLLSNIDYQYGLWIPYFSLFAGIAHIALAIKAKKIYNPGLLISLFLNIPIGIWSIIYLLEAKLLENMFLNPHMMIGLGVNALLPIAGIILLKKHQKNG